MVVTRILHISRISGGARAGIPYFTPIQRSGILLAMYQAWAARIK